MTDKKTKPITKSLNSEEITNYEEEKFFNKDSFKNFITKTGIDVLGDDMYISNDIHKEDIITPNDKRISSEIMTLAEYTRILSERAKQIENGSPIFIDIKNESNPIKIAEQEILLKKCPMKITRYMTKHIVEIYEVNEMIIPFQ